MPEKESHAVIEGSSPPAVFVSSRNYPRLAIGPMVPELHGDTSLLDEPERWLGKSFEEILSYRKMLVRGLVNVNRKEVIEPNEKIVRLHELLISSRPVDSILKLSKPPTVKVSLSEFVPPLGPYGEMVELRIFPSNSDRRIEKVYYDIDMKAEEAIFYLYTQNSSVNTIQKVLSLGMIGLKSKRKIIPTRWSITAVDEIIGRKLIEMIKDYETIDSYRVYSFEIYRNKYVAILIPSKWKFEWIEAWFPSTLWNQDSNGPYIEGDYEGYSGKKDYARVGGCYYSVRLAIAEHLLHERRQAGALILREVYPGFFARIGVWNVRESVRTMMKGKYSSHETFEDALLNAMSYLKIRLEEWSKISKIIRQEMLQTKLNGG